MRKVVGLAVAARVVLLAASGGPALAQQPTPTPTLTPTPAASASRIIANHQVDRYEAIARLRKALQADPRNLTDWVLLGELAQEAAMEAPADLAPGYFRLEREAYESALKLPPNNPQYKAAAEFSRQQEQGIGAFQSSRSRATAAYIEARRQELARSGNIPTLRAYPAPAPSAPQPSYQPYVGAQGTPYTYQQHYDSFFGPVEPRSPGQEVTSTERGALVKPAARAAPP